MATKVKPVESVDPNLKLAGPEWGECAGQPLVEVKLPLQEPDENNPHPDQNVHYIIASKNSKNTDYVLVRGRKSFIPRDHFLVLYQSFPEIL